MKQFLFNSALLIVLLYLGVLVFLYFFQNSLIFFPKRLNSDYQFSFSNFEERFFQSKSGSKINYLLFKAPSSKGMILYFHGNAGALDSWGMVGQEIVEKLGLDVWIIDYPGYGKSSEKLPSSGEELIEIGSELVDIMP